MPRRVFLALLAFFLNFCATNAQSGRELTDLVAEFLQSSQNHPPIFEPLEKTSFDSFPENIWLSFPPTEREPTSQTENARNKIVLVFFQEDVLSRTEAFSALFESIEKTKRKTEVDFLFTALDRPVILGGEKTGTGVFAANRFNSEELFALFFSFKEENTTATLFTGNRDFSTPLWLTKLCTEVFEVSSIPFEISPAILSLYRLNILKGDARIEECMRYNIPCAKVEIGIDELNFIEKLVQLYSTEKSGDWDSHYFFLAPKYFSTPLFISEQAFILFEIATITLSLFLICGLSFVGKASEKYKRDFIKSSPLIFLTMFISFSAIFFAKKMILVFDFFDFFSPFEKFFFIIACSIFFVQFFLNLFEYFHIPVAAFIFGYVATFVAVATILIFSAFDLLLFLMFGFEYAILSIFRRARTHFLNALELVLLALPFAPYALALAQNASEISLRPFFKDSILPTFLTMLALFPFNVIVARFSLRTEFKAGEKGFGVWKTRVSLFFSPVFLTILLFLPLIPLQKAWEKNVQIETAISPEKIEKNDRKTLFATLSRTDFRGITTNNIFIETHIPAERISISIKGNGSSPLLESTYGYHIQSDGSANILIPDKPPKSISIDYVTPTDEITEIFIKAYFFDGNDFWFEEKNLRFGGVL